MSTTNGCKRRFSSLNHGYVLRLPPSVRRHSIPAAKRNRFVCALQEKDRIKREEEAKEELRKQLDHKEQERVRISRETLDSSNCSSLLNAFPAVGEACRR